MMVPEIDSDVVLKKWKPTDPSRPPGRYAVKCEKARGLYARLYPSGAIAFIFRYKHLDAQRQLSFGQYPAVSLASARDKTREAYAHVKAGRDPAAVWAAEHEAAKEDAARRVTFADAVELYMQSGRIKALKTDKLRAQRRYVLEAYAVPIIGKLFVDEITDEDVQRVLDPIWREKPATADKVLQYMSGVFGNSIALKQRKAANPATRTVLEVWIAAQGQRDSRHHAALSIDDAPEWFAALGEREGMGALALKFLALTAARSGMVRGMTWGEIRNFEQRRVWTIPASRMKSSRKKSDRAERPKPFRVPLSDAAIELLKGVDRREGVDLVFPAPRDGQLSDMTLLKVMKSLHAVEIKAGRTGWVDDETGVPAVPHGLRSTFRGWVSERTSYPLEMGEVALAHSVGDKTQKAYDRGDMMDRRRDMMNDWADYLTGKQSSDTNVDPLATAIATLRDTGLSIEEIVARLNGDNVIHLPRDVA